jgi:CRP-like cAMP-binding protein/DNA-binding CsgD family transcriptional regulator
MTPVLCNERIDILDYLPHSAAEDYRAGEVIYDAGHPAERMFLIIQGRVQVSQDMTPDRRLVLDIYTNDEIFGESAVLHLPQCPDLAVALETTRVMTWTTDKLCQIMHSRPEVGIALAQILAARLVEARGRLGSFANATINQRLAHALAHLAERLGSRMANGSIVITGLKHKLLADYTVASRATITHWMGNFRRHGLLEYDRNSVLVYPDALKQWIEWHESHPGPAAKPSARLPEAATTQRQLSPREYQVMEYVAQGLKNKQIAERLCIAEQTVKNHLQNVFETLQVKSRRQAVHRLADVSSRWTLGPQPIAPPQLRQVG